MTEGFREQRRGQSAWGVIWGLTEHWMTLPYILDRMGFEGGVTRSDLRHKGIALAVVLGMKLVGGNGSKR